MEKEKEGKNVLHKLKKALNLTIDPDEREAKVLEIVSQAVRREGTTITCSQVEDTVYLTNEEERFIIKIQDNAFTLVLMEASKILLNVMLNPAISHKLRGVANLKVKEDIERIESAITNEGDKVLEDFYAFLAKDEELEGEIVENVGE